THNLDKVAFERLRECAIEQYQRGGMVSFSWHTRNPKTGGDAWDNSDSTVVAAILPGGEHYQKMLSWLDKVSEFFLSLQTKDGTLVPVIFRPWHEHTGSWFWWGQDLCSTEQYKELWKMTYDYLQRNKVTNVLLAYSPGMEPNSVEEYLERYPGDEIIDVLGTDIYQYESAQYKEWLEKELAIMTNIGQLRDKPIALTETGLEGIPDSTWWTQTLLPIISKYPLSYVLVWRNARERITHYYAPYPGQVSADDFIEFYRSPKTLFIGDNFELYK
ncbi:MAG: glycosyl hydrolase, partial [Parabacteroides sp.]|nr:glycosyl hydrolase [Parabacteroides sp.]